MNEVVRFYLRHQRRIDEWAALKSDAAAFAHRFFLDVGRSLRDTPMDGEAQVYVQSDGTPKFLVHRPHWRTVDAEDERAFVVGVGLEWPKNGPLFQGGAAPYSCIWVNNHTKSRALHDALHPALVNRLRTDLTTDTSGRPYRTRRSWMPYYRNEPAGDDYWTDEGLEAYAQQLRDTVTGLWSRTWQQIDDELSTLGIEP